MNDLIRRGADNRLRVISESTAGFPAGDVARKKLGADQVREVPAEAIGLTPLSDDAVVVFRAGGPLAARLSRASAQGRADFLATLNAHFQELSDQAEE